jgi:hypothetical protein
MRLDPNMADPDAFYAALAATGEGLTEDATLDLLLRLVLLLANQVGDAGVLEACLAEAARPVRTTPVVEEGPRWR